MSPTVHVTRARLVPFRDGSEHAEIYPGAWAVTHGLGGPAAETFTEVSFAPEALIDTDGRPLPLPVIEEAVRLVADQLYRDRWAFVYAPEAVLRCVEVYGMRRRERVHVEHIDVW